MVRGYLHNKESFREIWLPTASMRTLKQFLSYSAKHKKIVHWLDFIRALLQTKVKNWVFLELDSRYTYYFLEYSSYFGRDLR